MTDSSSPPGGETWDSARPEHDLALRERDVPWKSLPHTGNSTLVRPEHSYGAPDAHTYKNLVIGGHARVHAGNQIVNNYYSNVTTDSAASGGGAAFLAVSIEILIQLLVLLQRLMANIPSQVQQPLVSFEDAHSRRSQIDISFVVSWDVFDVALRATFANMPGHERVIQNRCRLSDAYQGQVLVDPNNPPNFAATFRPGHKFFMSMHFERYEVSTRDCPRCRHLQSCAPGLDTICNQCGFIYRDAVKDVPIYSGNHVTRNNPTVSPFDRVMPSQFLRISVSAYTTPPRRRIQLPRAGHTYKSRPDTHAYNQSIRRVNGCYSGRVRPDTYAYGLHADDRHTGRSTPPQPSLIPRLVELEDTSSIAMATLTPANVMSMHRPTNGFAKLAHVNQSNVPPLEEAPGDLSASAREDLQNNPFDSTLRDMQAAFVDADLACELASMEEWFGRVLTVSERGAALVAMSPGRSLEQFRSFYQALTRGAL